ncbi:transposase [Herbaspirillum sp. alder98]|uniref:transposase n=1 Tax=Herbaspirillum sp. alder98 TaxID=2913096 RepID=UPI001CD8E35A|nr:transposase [Herbaspirillum sp. alder98]MCA1325625.1 transposase [Herbaspirillum sp. alder98]
MPETTTRSAFLHLMDAAIPWDMLARAACAGAEPETAGCDVRQGLRIYFLQHWFGWSDEAMVDAMHDSRSIRYFLQQRNGTPAAVPAATLQGFRQWLERRDMGRSLLEAMARHLAMRGIVVEAGQATEPCAVTRVPAPSAWPGGQRASDGVAACR